MAKTIATLVIVSFLSFVPSVVFAQLDEPITNLAYSTYYWYLYVAVAAGSVIVLLMATNSLLRPTSFASLPIYQFFALTIFVVFFIFSIAYFPSDFSGTGFPISTGPYPDSQNQTQWVLNIGGIPNDPNSSGLQIPIYVIIAGILGAYIRYLYYGISEFNKAFLQDLENFEKSYRILEKEFDSYIIFTGKPCDPPYEIVISRAASVFDVLGAIKIRSQTIRKFEEEASKIEKEPVPPDKLYEHYTIYHADDKSVKNQIIEVVGYKGWRRHLWSKIRQAQSDIKIRRFVASSVINTHILKTVGSFFLAPLLAILAWLLLSISGTDDLFTFALVSFTIGLTTKRIIERVMNFVGDKLDESKPAVKDTAPAAPASRAVVAEEEEEAAAPASRAVAAPAAHIGTQAEQKPSIVIDPKHARAGQLLTVRGNGFQANSHITLQYDGLEGIDNHIQEIQSSSKGEFGFQFWLTSSHPKGTYSLIAKDDHSKSATEEFTVS